MAKTEIYVLEIQPICPFWQNVIPFELVMRFENSPGFEISLAGAKYFLRYFFLLFWHNSAVHTGEEKDVLYG